MIIIDTKKEIKYGTRHKSEEKIDDKEVVQRKGMRFILNKTIEDPQERLNIVKNIINELGEDSFKSTEKRALSDYIIDATVKQNKERKGPIMTANRMVTIRNRETSSDALIDNKLEGGENTFHQLLSKNPRNSILTNKVGITEADLKEVPGLKQLVDTIDELVQQLDKDIKKGKDVRYQRKVIIELRKMQYDMKNAYRQPMHLRNNVNSFGEQKSIDFDFTNLESVSAFIKDYVDIKKELNNNDLGGDTYIIIKDFDNLIKSALEDEQELLDILKLKMLGYNNTETCKILTDYYGKKVKMEFVGKAYRDIIPKKIVEEAIKQGY